MLVVACSGCGDERRVTPLTAEKIRCGRSSGLCIRCGRENGPPIRVTQSHRRYWTERFTQAEILEMAVALFGPPTTWPDSVPVLEKLAA